MLTSIALVAALIAAPAMAQSTTATATTTAAAPLATSTLTCTPFLADDAYCGFMSPAQAVFTVGESSKLVSSYLPQLSTICPDVKTVSDVVPVVFCLGAVGPCNGATFKLPTTDANGLPSNFSEVGAFYNNAKFAQVLPALERLNIQPPCYDTCNRAAKSILNCPALRSILNPNADPCEGLPTTNCAANVGPKGGALPPTARTTVAPTTTAAASASTTTTKSAAMKSGLGWFALAVAAVFGATTF
ncbi:hypothetical protein BC829DRAFT_383457 [Chytridium lagenaria]|nr:hypothetical protein BC829DRAFT_383457 [Chytridium lagenaria]